MRGARDWYVPRMSRRISIWILIIAAFVVMVAIAARDAADSNVSVTASTLTRSGVSYKARVLQSGVKKSPKIALIHISGEIVNGQGAVNGSTTGGDDIVTLLEAIGDSGRFDGVLMEVNTPGGAVLASDEISQQVKRVEQHYKLPVVSWMRDIAASGGYYVSAPASRIVAAPSTMTGSIGVILHSYNVGKLADKIGVKEVVIKSGPHKDILSEFREMTPDEHVILQNLIDEAYGDFVSTVATGRDLARSKVLKIADGRIYTGRQALDNGLVDELGTRREAYSAVGKLANDGKSVDSDDVQVVDYQRSYGVLQSLLSGNAQDVDMAALFGAASDIAHGRGVSSSALQSATGASASNGLADLEYRAVIG